MRLTRVKIKNCNLEKNVHALAEFIHVGTVIHLDLPVFERIPLPQSQFALILDRDFFRNPHSGGKR